jgi:hypothetical protein
MSTVDLAGARWRKSSFSGGEAGSECVEVAFAGPAAALRDSKNPGGPALVLPMASFQHSLRGVAGR